VKTSVATLAVRFLHPVINDIAYTFIVVLMSEWRITFCCTAIGVSYGIHPRAVGMPKCVCSERSAACFDRGVVEAAPVPRYEMGYSCDRVARRGFLRAQNADCFFQRRNFKHRS
jgi:hypothetical protein